MTFKIVNWVAFEPKTNRILKNATICQIDRANFQAQAVNALCSCGRNAKKQKETLIHLCMRGISEGILGKFKP